MTGPDPPTGCKLLLQRGSDSEGVGAPHACVTWLPPPSAAGSLLPREHDCVRQLQVSLVAHSTPVDQLAGGSGEACLRQAATELHGLSWLYAAFQGACLRTVAGGGPAAPASAHLPLHAALASQLQCLLAEAASCNRSS